MLRRVALMLFLELPTAAAVAAAAEAATVAIKRFYMEADYDMTEPFLLLLCTLILRYLLRNNLLHLL